MRNRINGFGGKRRKENIEIKNIDSGKEGKCRKKNAENEIFVSC